MRLWTLPIAHLVERRGRAVFAGAAIMLGIALAVAAPVVHQSNVRFVDHLIRDGAGATDLVAAPTAMAPGAGLPDDTPAKIATLPQVGAAAGVVAFPTAIEAPGAKLELRVNRRPPGRVFAFDPAAARSIYRPQLKRGRLAEPGSDEAVVSQRLATRLGLHVGSEIKVGAPAGKATLQVVGILKDTGVARLQLGNGVFTSLATGQRLADAPGAVHLVAVNLAPGVDAAAWLAANGQALGPAVTFSDASEVEGFARRQISAMSAAFGGIAFVVLFLAGFMIHLTLTVEVAERSAEHGTLRAIGATRGQLRTIVLLEAVSLAAIAAPIGLLAGTGLAALGVRVGADTVVGVPPLVLDWRVFVLATTVGTGTALLAALRPAVRAGRLQPVEAIRGSEDDRSLESTRLPIGLVCVAGGVVALAGEPRPLGLAAGLVGLLVGTVLVSPSLLALAARGIGVVADRWSNGVTTVAVLHLAKERTRSAYTMSLVTIVLAIVFAAGAIAASADAAVVHQIDRFFGADFEVEAASSFDPGFAHQLAAIEGVARTSPRTTTDGGAVRIVEPGRDETTSVQMVEPASFFSITSFVWIDGDDNHARAALERGGHILVPDIMARRLGKQVGDTLTLATRTGPKPYVIAATISSPSTNPTVVIANTDGAADFGATRPTSVLVDVAPGFDLAQVRSQVERQLGGQVVFLVVTASTLKADVQAQIDGAVSGFSVLLLLAAIVGALGLANTLAVSVLHRRREIGTMRSVGAYASQVAAVSVTEAALLAAFAFFASLPVGYVMSGPLLRVMSAALGEHTVAYVFPWSWVPIMAAGSVAIAAIAAFAPARRAARLLPVETLRFE